MDALDLQLLKEKWEKLIRLLADRFGEEPDLQALLFLIGVQEFGQGPQKYSKDEKQDLMHFATCKLLSQFGYYELNGADEHCWPDWQLSQNLPPLTLRDQDLLLNQPIVDYFDNAGLV